MRALIFVLVLATAAGALTDVQAAERFPFGIKGGVSWATWDWGSVGEPEGNTNYHGYQIGAFVEWDFDWPVSFLTEGYYAARGTKIDQGRDVAEFKTKYIDVPILLKYTIELEYSRPYFILGPSFNFLTTAKYFSGSDEEDIKDDLESMEYGLVAGFGIHMKAVLLEFRYSQGLTDANKAGGITSSFYALNFGITF